MSAARASALDAVTCLSAGGTIADCVKARLSRQVKRIEAPTKSIGGVLLPENTQSKLNEGVVLSVGPGRRDKDGALLPMGVKTDDKVLLPQYGGNEVTIDEEELVLFRDDDILGVRACTSRPDQASPGGSPSLRTLGPVHVGQYTLLTLVRVRSQGLRRCRNAGEAFSRHGALVTALEIGRKVLLGKHACTGVHVLVARSSVRMRSSRTRGGAEVCSLISRTRAPRLQVLTAAEDRARLCGEHGLPSTPPPPSAAPWLPVSRSFADPHGC